MRIKNINNSAFSLLEILLASLIFIISVGGVFVTLDSMRKPVVDKESALSAAIFGKQVLESLRSQVDARTFYNTCADQGVIAGHSACEDFTLSMGTHLVLPASSGGHLPAGLTLPPVASTNYVNYTVSCGSDGSTSVCDADTARRVDFNITWNSAQ